MKLAHVKITNVLGIEMLEFDAGRWNSISGPNGAGKSSVLKAIEGAIGGGNRAELIRQGADSGEAVFTFDNGYELTAKFTPKKTTRVIRTPENATINGTVGWIEQRLNPLSFSPIRFVEADDKERVAMLLGIAKLELTTADLVEAIGDVDTGDLQLPTPAKGSTGFIADPLAVIDAASKAIYDLRTGLNRSAKDQRGYIAEMERTIPKDLQKPPDDSALRREYKAITDELAATKKTIADVEAKELATARKRAVDGEKAARAELAEKLLAIAAEEKSQIKVITDTSRAALEMAQSESSPRIEEIREQLGKNSMIQTEWWRAEETRDTIAKREESANALESQAAEATAAIKRLEALKVKLLSEMPVDGLTVENGRLMLRGVPYETTNTAAQIRAAMQIALSAAGDLKLIQLDGLERLDTAARQAVAEWAAGSDAQFFVTRVTDGEKLEVSNT